MSEQLTIERCRKVVSLDELRSLRRALADPEQTSERLVEVICGVWSECERMEREERERER